MMHDVRCGSCQAVLGAADIDVPRELATCTRCGRLTDLRRLAGGAAQLPQNPQLPRARPRVQLPFGMSMTTLPERLVIRRRWLRSKHWLLLCIIAAASIYLGYLWTSLDPTVWLVLATMFVLSWNYNLAAMFLNRTVISAARDGIEVEHGPLPSLFARNARVAKSQIEQLYATKHGTAFAVQANLKSAPPLRLVAPLVTAEQALFVEQTLERALGLGDFAVEGELGNSAIGVASAEPKGARSGAALAIALPLLVVAVVGSFLAATSAEVSGSLRAAAALGTWTFQPDDCESGQHEGFGGVVLKSSRTPGQVVRVVRDPVRGNLVVLGVSGGPNHVISAETCPHLVIDVRRGNTNINDVWTQDGSLALECPELSGKVTFEGCH